MNFEQSTHNDAIITSEMIKFRELQLGIPAGTTAEQWAAIQRSIDFAKQNGIDFVITVITP